MGCDPIGRKTNRPPSTTTGEEAETTLPDPVAQRMRPLTETTLTRTDVQMQIADDRVVVRLAIERLETAGRSSVKHSPPTPAGRPDSVSASDADRAFRFIPGSSGRCQLHWQERCRSPPPPAWRSRAAAGYHTASLSPTRRRRDRSGEGRCLWRRQGHEERGRRETCGSLPSGRERGTTREGARRKRIQRIDRSMGRSRPHPRSAIRHEGSDSARPVPHLTLGPTSPSMEPEEDRWDSGPVPMTDVIVETTDSLRTYASVPPISQCERPQESHVKPPSSSSLMWRTRSETMRPFADSTHPHRIVEAPRLFDELVRRGHGEAAAEWAIEDMVDEGKLVARDRRPRLPGSLRRGLLDTTEQLWQSGQSQPLPVHPTGEADASDPASRGSFEVPRMTIGELIQALEGSEDAKAQNSAEIDRTRAEQGEIIAYMFSLRAGGVCFHPDENRMPGVGRIVAMCDEWFGGNGLTSQAVRQLRGRLVRVRRCTLAEADAITLVEASEILCPPDDSDDVTGRKHGSRQPSAKGKRRKRGRQHVDPKFDKRVREAWETGCYPTYAALAQELKCDAAEVKRSLDRTRQREKKSAG